MSKFGFVATQIRLTTGHGSLTSNENAECP